MKKLIGSTAAAIAIMAMSLNVSAINLGGTETNNTALAAAAASNNTVVDMDSYNQNTNLNGNVNLNDNSNQVSNDSKSVSSATGGNSVSGSISGSISKAGDNSNVINIEGDRINYPASSVPTSLGQSCVDAMAAQNVAGGISLGGESPDCKALRTAKSFFVLANMFKGTPEGEEYLKKGHAYANRAGLSGAELGMKRVRNFIVDAVITVLPFVLL